MKRITLFLMVLGVVVSFSSCTPKRRAKPENCFTWKPKKCSMEHFVMEKHME